MRRLVESRSLAQIPNDLGVGLDGDPLCDKVLANHINEGIALDIFGVAAIEDADRTEVRLAAELGNSFCDLVGMRLFLAGMFEEFLRHALGVDTFRQIVMRLVAQHANDLRGKRLVQNAHYGGDVRLIGLSHGAGFHMLSCAPTNLLDGAQEGSIGFWFSFLLHWVLHDAISAATVLDFVCGCDGKAFLPAAVSRSLRAGQ